MIAQAAAATAVVGCASAGSGSQTTIMQSANGQPAPATVEWTGKFTNMTKTSGEVAGVHGQTNISGNVLLIALGQDRMHAEIDIANANSSNPELFWALVAGRCGSNSIPALAVNQFPVIDVNSSGRGRVTGEVPLALPTSGSYHVNVYMSHGGDESDVLTCANLRMEPRK